MKSIPITLALLAAAWLPAAEPAGPIVLTIIAVAPNGQVFKGPSAIAPKTTVIALDEKGARLQTDGTKIIVPAPGRVRILLGGGLQPGFALSVLASRSDEVALKYVRDDYPPSSAIWPDCSGEVAGKQIKINYDGKGPVRLEITDPANCYFFKSTGNVARPLGRKVEATKPYQISMGDQVIVYDEASGKRKGFRVVAIEEGIALVEFIGVDASFARDVDKR